MFRKKKQPSVKYRIEIRSSIVEDARKNLVISTVIDFYERGYHFGGYYLDLDEQVKMEDSATIEEAQEKVTNYLEALNALTEMNERVQTEIDRTVIVHADGSSIEI